jgi:hypothetical protein
LTVTSYNIGLSGDFQSYFQSGALEGLIVFAVSPVQGQAAWFFDLGRYRHANAGQIRTSAKFWGGQRGMRLQARNPAAGGRRSTLKTE